MEIVYGLVLLLHLLGMASLVGGWMVQLRARGERWISPAMLHGALVQLVTGVALVGLAEALPKLGHEVNNAKIGVKLVVTLLVLGLAWVNRRKTTVPDGVYFIVGGLAVGNVAIAALW